MLFLVFFSLFSLSLAHSWVERLRILDVNGTMIGREGYMRGALSRLNPAFNDLRQQYLLPPIGRDPNVGILPNDTICNTSYRQELPPLKARPGEYIALQYQENGHVTLPGNSPHKANSGVVYIYGTPFPVEDDALLSIHKVWNAEGTGGDKRGVLLASRYFDDGRCYQINNGSISTERQISYNKIPMDPQGADLWCQNDIRLPGIIDTENYTIYWVWDWPSLPTAAFPQGQPEIYTSCMDIMILPGLQADNVAYHEGQDLNFAGVETQMGQSQHFY
jgi:hypothetical protein